MIYDGKEHAITALEQTVFTVDGSVYTVSGLNVEGVGTDAGEYTVRVWGTLVVSDSNGNDVTAQFTVHTDNGKLIINKRSITVESASAEKQYDGLPLTANTVSVTAGSFAGAEGLLYTVAGTQTLIGSSPNTFSYAAKANTKLDNYIITAKFGKLTVHDRTQKYEITLEADSGEYTYDGKEKRAAGFKTLSFVIEGNTYTAEGASASVTATAAGTYPVEIKQLDQLVIKDALGNDVTSQFIVATVNGTLKINPRRVVLTSVSLEKEYDGKPLTNGSNAIVISEGGFADGEGIDVTFTGTQTNVGTSANSLTYTLKQGTNAKNYEIRVVEGQLKVVGRNDSTKYQITLIANSADYLYTGKVEYVSGFKTLEFTFDGVTYEVSGVKAFAEGIDAGKYTVNITGDPTVTAPDGSVVTDQFKIDYVRGVMNIAHREIYLVSDDLTKEFDGTPLTNGNTPLVNVNRGDGFAEGQGVKITFTGSQTLPGTVANSFTYTFNEGTKAANYHIHVEEGQLTVTNRNVAYKIYLTANSGTFKYDGTEKTVSGFNTLIVGLDKNNNNLPDAGEPQAKFDITASDKISFTWNGVVYQLTGLTAIGRGTNADEYAVSASGTAKILNAAGDDVSNQFAVVVKEGRMVIGKRSVTMTSPTATKQFDGRPLTAYGITVTGDGFVKGEGAAYQEIGSQTYVGESPNTFYYTLNQGTMAENYEITKEFGKLTVTERTDKFNIALEANSGTFKYDGTEKSVEGFKTLTFICDGVTYTVEGVTASAKGTDAGEYTVSITGTPIVRDENGMDLTRIFNVSMSEGKMTIAKRVVYITSASAEKEYDGAPLTNPIIRETGDRFAEGEGADYTMPGYQTEVGESPNHFWYTLHSNTKAENYEIITQFGLLRVYMAAGSITLHKVDAEDRNTALAGAEFALYLMGTNGDVLIGKYRTDAEGKISVTDLAPGMYYWVEVAAPEGYMLDAQKYYLTVTVGAVTDVTVSNVRTSIPEVFGDDHYAYIIGYPDGTVRPEAPITRAEVATIFFRLLSDNVRDAYMTRRNNFTDVSEDAWFNTAISTMAAMGILRGDPDGAFRPDDSISRAEFAAIAARFEENGDTTPANFTDRYDHWSAEEVSIAANNGWILGYEDNTFRPDQDITRAEAMTVINRVLQRIVKDPDHLIEGMVTWSDNLDPSKWYYLAVQEATNSHYYFRQDNGYEIWIDLRPIRDWKELES